MMEGSPREVVRLVPECGQVAFTWKNTTTQSVPWAPVVPTTRPNIVGPRAATWESNFRA